MDAPLTRRLLETMTLIRRFEEQVAACFAAGEIPGFIHLSVGQEAIPAVFCAALDPTDLVGATHRGHGVVLAKGADVRATMAEIFGKQAGLCHGRGGSMHLADLPHGIIGTNGIVGASLPIATGAALAARVRGSGQVVVSFFGDGAANTGAFHEALNLASVWQLPIVFVCENNGYAEFTAQAVHMRGESVAARAAGYAMPGVVVDGNDAVALDKVARETVGRARAGGGPTLVEALTTRWRGHHEGDQQRYRPAGEADAGRDRDPIARLRSTALAANWLDEADLAAIDAESGRIVADALDYARASATPPPGAVAEGVYA